MLSDVGSQGCPLTCFSSHQVTIQSFSLITQGQLRCLKCSLSHQPELFSLCLSRCSTISNAYKTMFSEHYLKCNKFSCPPDVLSCYSHFVLRCELTPWCYTLCYTVNVAFFSLLSLTHSLFMKSNECITANILNRIGSTLHAVVVRSEAFILCVYAAMCTYTCVDQG